MVMTETAGDGVSRIVIVCEPQLAAAVGATAAFDSQPPFEGTIRPFECS